MNGTATGGKNLQTVFPASEVKGAYEMGLLSPAAPNAEHHPLFSSLAKRQRTPVSVPLEAPHPKPRTARNYGPRRLRYRCLEALKPWQVHMLHQADAVASQLGLHLNTFLTANYHGTFAGKAAMPLTFAKAMKRMCQWLRDNSTRPAYVYVHENPSDEKPNSHVLVHVPPYLLPAFKAKAGAWFDALDGGVKVEARNDTQRRAKGLGTRLAYMCKGADDFTCRLYEEAHPETKKGQFNQHTANRKVCDKQAERFTADTASKTGVSERAVGFFGTIKRGLHEQPKLHRSLAALEALGHGRQRP